MNRDVVEVIARWGETIVDVAHVGPRERYGIGTSPEAQLAVPGFGYFPVVDRGVVRTPATMERIARGATTILRAGSISLELTRTQLATRTVPSPPIERRVPAWLTASLVAHLAVWLVAIATAPLERVTPRRELPRLVRIAPAPLPPEPQPQVVESKPEPEPQPVASTRSPPPAAERAPQAADALRALGQASKTLVVDARHLKKSFEGVDHLVDPETAGRGNFGNGRDFEVPPTVASGDYVTSTVPVKQCAKHDSRCKLTGPTTSRFVRAGLLSRMPEIYSCFLASASGPGTIVLEFTIKGDGSVEHARGVGPGESGECAAAIASTILYRAQWPRSEAPGFDARYDTRVRWPISFK